MTSRRSLSERSETKRASVFARAGLAGLAVGVLVASLVGAGGAVLQADPAAAADEELTSSAVTLTNEDDALEAEGAPFPDLEVTVSQTKDLVSQGIQVSWTGGKQSARPDPDVGGANFLQIAQCWGEDPDNPGHPDRRTCQYGGIRAGGAARDGGIPERDAIAEEDVEYTDYSQSAQAYTAIPFVAVNAAGIVDDKLAPVDRVVTTLTTDDQGNVVSKPASENVNLSANQFFTSLTTNEVKWAGSGADGSGSVPFEVQTNMQSTGLGCGSPMSHADGSVTGQSCWLVVIPRGVGDSGSPLITRPGLWWDAWEHHVAVKLEFKPLGVRCQLGAAERQLAGSELVAAAMASWQPQLCKGENGAPFVLSEGNEADALARAAGTEPSPLAFTSRPLDLSRTGNSADPVIYAPIAVAAVAISFSIDRQPHPVDASPEELSRQGLPMTEMNLTPRLVAKLLTASYRDALPSGADRSHIGYVDARNPGKNPRSMMQDPEFLEVNDAEWAHQLINSPSVADALVPSGRSDLAVRLWEYVLADAQAKAWLDGAPDEHGMVVNPYYSPNSTKNPTGSGLALPSDGFPKADPIERPDTTAQGGSGAVNLVTLRPFTSSFADGAHYVLRGDGMLLGAWNSFSTPPKYDKTPRDLLGNQKVIGLTTSPSAELYQTVTASLRNPAGQFVAPTQDGLSAAAAAMTPSTGQPKVLEYNPASDAAKSAPTAYPLTMPVYAALNPKQSDAGLRAVYANVIRHAAANGQVPGTDLGQLPPGYAPLPSSWVDQALEAAGVIEAGGVATGNPPAGGGSGPASSGGAGRNAAAVVPPASTPQTPGAPLTTDPIVTGQAAGELTGAATPDDPEMGPMAAAVPIGIAVGLVAALAVLALTRIRRRA